MKSYTTARVFVATPKGVCILNPIMSEYTLCGDAFDLGTDEPGYEHQPTNSRAVTCCDCREIILCMRGVRTA